VALPSLLKFFTGGAKQEQGQAFVVFWLIFRSENTNNNKNGPARRRGA
jgi:hypothetical protein